MKIAGAYTLAAGQEVAYRALQNPEVLAKCMPGIESLTPTGPDEYDMQMKMSIASVQGLFSGRVRIADQNPFQSFRLLVEGKGKIGFMNGNGLLMLSQTEQGAEVKYEGDVQVGGVIAAVGQRLIDTTAKLLIKRFFDCLSKQIEVAAAS